jgi:hypothetical protein
MIKLLGKQVLVAFHYEKLHKYCFDCKKSGMVKEDAWQRALSR